MVTTNLRRSGRRAALALAAPAAAQEAWPDRPLRLVVPFAPGGVTDSTVASNPFALTVPASLGVTTLGEVVALAARERGAPTTPPPATARAAPHHGPLPPLRRRRDEARPYRGGPAVQDLLGGGVAAYFGKPAEVTARIEADLPIWREAVQVSGATLD